jgi:hypothetical protein
MATLLKCGGLFLHVPRTGGGWIGEVLEASDLVYAHVGDRDATAADLEPLERLLQAPHAYGKGNRPLFKFCFVRHPQRWYECWYRAEGGGDTFDAFVQRAVRERPGYLSALYDSYTKDAHFVGRFESLIGDLETALTLLRTAIPEDIGRTLTAPPAETELALDWKIQQALEESEREAYLRYGYAGADEKPGTPRLAPFSPSLPLKGPFIREKGFAWKIEVPELARFADSDAFPRRSMVSLLENGMPLGVAHASHEDIRTVGGGLFSHWNDAILFSTRDNSDPNDTGRRYDLAWAFPAAPDAYGLQMRSSRPAEAAKAA